MTTTSPIPSRSQISTWDTNHLVDAGATWRTNADHWQELFTQVASQMPAPGGTPWEGAASEAAQARASADAIRVGELAERLRRVSAVARNGADTIRATTKSVLHAIADVESAGFTVGEDLSVTSRFGVLNPAAELMRRIQAEALAADVRAKAALLLATDHAVAAEITSAASAVRDITLAAESDVGVYQASKQLEPQVLAATWQLWKQAPNGGEPPPPPSPRVRGLPPDGLRPPVSGTLTPGPASRPSEQRVGGQSLWDEKGGEWRYFGGDRYHNPHWDYNPHNMPKGAPWQNISIDSRPPVKVNPTPVEAAPPRPAVPVPAPAEAPPEPKAPPVRGGPPGGLPLGGGALVDGSMPYLVESPEPDVSGPDLPVIGDGKPD